MTLSLDSYAQRAFIIVIAIHIVWIMMHLYLVQNTSLNPWKLGGYGMYTKPTPRFDLDIKVNEQDGQVYKSRKASRFRKANWHFIYPCRMIDADDISALYMDFPDAIGKETTINVSIKNFERYPIVVEYVPTISLNITWLESPYFTWEGSICGNKVKGSSK